MTTTDTPTPVPSDPQAVTLSESELAALKAASEGKILPKAMRKRLWDLSLVGHDDSTGEPYLTIAGRALLAEAAPAPTRCANCGMSITASASPLCTDCAIAKMASDPEIQREMTAQQAAAEAGDAYEKLVYQWRDTHLTLCNELDVEFDPEGSNTRYVEAINVLKVTAEDLRDQLTAARDRERVLRTFATSLKDVAPKAEFIPDPLARIYAEQLAQIEAQAQAALSAAGSEVTK